MLHFGCTPCPCHCRLASASFRKLARRTTNAKQASCQFSYWETRKSFPFFSKYSRLVLVLKRRPYLMGCHLMLIRLNQFTQNIRKTGIAGCQSPGRAVVSHIRTHMQRHCTNAIEFSFSFSPCEIGVLFGLLLGLGSPVGCLLALCG